MAQIFCDFSAYTDNTDITDASNSGVSAANGGVWSKQRSGGGWTYKVVSGAFVLDDPTEWGDYYTLVTTDAVGSVTGDIEIYCRMKMTNVTALDRHVIGPALINTAANTCYGVTGILSTGKWRAAIYSTGGSQNGTSTDASGTFTPSADTYFKVRLRLERATNTLKVKAWADGDSEPTYWGATGATSDMTWTNSTITSVRPGFAVATSWIWEPYTYDCLGIGTDGDAAPTAAGASAVAPLAMAHFARMRA